MSQLLLSPSVCFLACQSCLFHHKRHTPLIFGKCAIVWITGGSLDFFNRQLVLLELSRSRLHHIHWLRDLSLWLNCLLLLHCCSLVIVRWLWLGVQESVLVALCTPASLKEAAERLNHWFLLLRRMIESALLVGAVRVKTTKLLAFGGPTRL